MTSPITVLSAPRRRGDLRLLLTPENASVIQTEARNG